jgi:hypothetical protein
MDPPKYDDQSEGGRKAEPCEDSGLRENCFVQTTVKRRE